MTAFALQLLLICLCLLPLYLLARFFWLRHKKQPLHLSHEIWLAVFMLFLGGLLVLVLRPSGAFSPRNMFADAAQRLFTGQDINLVPFTTIRRFFRLQQSHMTFNPGFGIHVAFGVNILGNVLMFVPVGLFPPLLWPRWRPFWKMLLVALLFPVCIESLQLFFGRTVDVDDVMLNALGVLLGYGIARLCLLIRARQRKRKQSAAAQTTPGSAAQ